MKVKTIKVLTRQAMQRDQAVRDMLKDEPRPWLYTNSFTRKQAAQIFGRHWQAVLVRDGIIPSPIEWHCMSSARRGQYIIKWHHRMLLASVIVGYWPYWHAALHKALIAAITKSRVTGAAIPTVLVSVPEVRKVYKQLTNWY